MSKTRSAYRLGIVEIFLGALSVTAFCVAVGFVSQRVFGELGVYDSIWWCGFGIGAALGYRSEHLIRRGQQAEAAEWRKSLATPRFDQWRFFLH